MNARQRRHARRQQRLYEEAAQRIVEDRAAIFAHRVAATMGGEAREVKRIPKWKRLAMLLGLSSALPGCAAKKPARAPLVIPFDCLREVQVADTRCNGTASPDTFDCNHVRVKASCVKAVR